jgi:hypothetical protein
VSSRDPVALYRRGARLHENTSAAAEAKGQCSYEGTAAIASSRLGMGQAGIIRVKILFASGQSGWSNKVEVE